MIQVVFERKILKIILCFFHFSCRKLSPKAKRKTLVLPNTTQTVECGRLTFIHFGAVELQARVFTLLTQHSTHRVQLGAVKTAPGGGAETGQEGLLHT